MYFRFTMLNTQKNIPSDADIERAERLRQIFEHLKEINEIVPVIVEGRKDASALRTLGLRGEILTLHNGKSLYDFCGEVIEKFSRVVILLDWDRKGEDLNSVLSDHLEGLWEEFSSFREIIRLLCQKDIRDIEGIPKLLRRLEGNESSWQ
ncbi:MAG: toprim domain-containing protein [Nitrospirota bacterium]